MNGSSVEPSHTDFTPALRSAKMPDLSTRLEAYNNYYDGGTLKLKANYEGGELVLEGVLRVHWGVKQPIQFREKDDQPQTKGIRRSYCMAINNGLNEQLLAMIDSDTLKASRPSLEDLLTGLNVTALPYSGLPADGTSSEPVSRNNTLVSPITSSPESEPDQTSMTLTSPLGSGAEQRAPSTELRRFNTVSYRGDAGTAVRRQHRRKRTSRRLSMINGHVFHSDTSVFIPSYGSVTTVNIDSHNSSEQVIKLLLEKFKVENNPDDYCLCIVKRSGETRVLSAADCPLVSRVMLGPHEDEAKIFIEEKHKVTTITEQVAPFINLPDAVLEGFLQKLDNELKAEIDATKTRYSLIKMEMEKRLRELSTQM